MILPIECTTHGCGERAVRWAPFCTGCGKPLVPSAAPKGGPRPETKLDLSPAGSVQIAPGAKWTASTLAGSLVVVGQESATVVRPTSESMLTSRSARAFKGGPRASLAFSRPWFALRDETTDEKDILTIGSGGMLLQDLGAPPQGEPPTLTIPLRRSRSPLSATGRTGTLHASSMGFFALEDADGTSDQTHLRHIVVKASNRSPWVPDCNEPGPTIQLPGRGWVIDRAATKAPDQIGLFCVSGAVATVGLADNIPTLLRLKVLDRRNGDVVGLAQAGGEDLICHILYQGRSTLVNVDRNGAERIIATPPNAALLSINPTFRHQNPVVGARFDDTLLAVRPLQLDLTDGLGVVSKLSRVQRANQEGLVAIDEHQRVVVESNHGRGMVRADALAAIEEVAFAELDWPHLWVIVDKGPGAFVVNRFVANEAPR